MRASENQARIPADTHGAQFARTFSRLVERLEILRHFGVRVETVHRIEIADGFHRLYGQIGSAAAAQDHDVDLTDVILYIFNGIHCNGKDGTHALRIAAGEYRHRFHIFALGKRVLHTLAQITVPDDAHFDFFHKTTPFDRFISCINIPPKGKFCQATASFACFDLLISDFRFNYIRSRASTFPSKSLSESSPFSKIRYERGVSFLGRRYGARVRDQHAALAADKSRMDMAEHKRIAAVFRKPIEIEFVAVLQKYLFAVGIDLRFGHKLEIGDERIHGAVAISFDDRQAVGERIQKSSHAERAVAFGQWVARPVIIDIAQKYHLLCPFFGKSLQQLL